MSNLVVVGLVLICTLVGLWSTSSSLCSCSDKLLRSWTAYSGGTTDSVLRRLGVPVWACGCALTVVDVPVVRQRQVPTAFRVLLRVWKRSLLCAASRYSHLDPGHYSYVLLVTGWHSAPVFSRQYMVASGRISGIFYVVSAHEQSALGNLDVISTSLVAGLPRSARLNSGYMFLFCFWRLLDVFPIFFYVLVYSDPAIESRPVLRGVFSLSFFKARFEELNMDFFVLQNGVVCTVDASAEFLPSFCTWKLDIMSSALVSDRRFFKWFRRVMMCGIFGAPVSDTGAGVAGVAGSLLPGDSAPGLCKFILRSRGHTRSLICH